MTRRFIFLSAVVLFLMASGPSSFAIIRHHIVVEASGGGQIVVLDEPGTADFTTFSSTDIDDAVYAADKAGWTLSQKDEVNSAMTAANAQVHPFCHTLYKIVDGGGDWWDFKCMNACQNCDKVDVVVDSTDGYVYDILSP